MSDVRCLAYMPARPGQRCGSPIVDSELLMCARHSLEARRRLRLREHRLYGGHEVYRHQLDPDGAAYYAVAEHTQVEGAAQASTPAAVFGEIDACNIERLPHCNLPDSAPRPDEDTTWEHFKLSRDDWSHT